MGMKNLFLAASVLALATVPAMAAEVTFECAYPVSGRAELSVATKAGNLLLTRSTDHQIHVLGRVHSSWNHGDKKALAIATHPPIEQTGNIVHIGVYPENLRGIKVDYEIQTPEDTLLDASTGVGSITVDRVGENAKISTGAGNIHAIGLHGGFSVSTGSGNIYAEQKGEGDVKVQTGAGKVELRNLQGGLNVEMGSGNIKVAGVPASAWKLKASRGNIDLWPGNAGFTLDASTGSGSIHADRQTPGQASPDHRHVAGAMNGGGPTVRLETGGGDIRIH
jgi:hypothetical protein